MIRVPLLIGLALVAIPARSDEVTNTRERDQLARFVWAGLRVGREKVHSGTFHAVGRRFDEDKRTGVMNAPARFFSAFDSVAHKLRFDSSRPVKEAGSGLVEGKSWVEKAYGGKYIRLEDRAISYFSLNPQVAILKPDDPPVSFIRPFDFRTFGLTYLSGFDDGVELESIIRGFEQLPCDALWKHPKGIYQLDYHQDKPPSYGTVSFWIDEAKDFAPIKLEARYGIGKRPSLADRPSQSSDTTWMAINGVWVPKTHQISYRVMPFSLETVRGYDLAFEWDKVNQEIPERYFTLDDLDLPDGIPVVDLRLWTPVVVDTVGGRNREAYPSLQTPSPGDSWWTTTTMTTISVVIGLVALGMIAFLVVRSRSST